jgi:flagellar hook-length control protein FliK
MPGIALNNLISFAAAPVGSQSAATSGSAGDFNDHLQRASQDGDADNQPVGASDDPNSADAASAPGQNFDPAPATDEGTQDGQSSKPSSASQTLANSSNDRATAKSDPNDNDRNKRSQSGSHGVTTTSGTSATTSATTASVSIVAQASAVDPTAASTDPAADAAANVKTSAAEAKAQASAGNKSATNLVDEQAQTTSASDSSASQAATGPASAADLQSRAANATQSINAVESSSAQQVQHAVAAADPAATVTQAVATAGMAAAMKSTETSSKARPSTQSAGPSVEASAGVDQPKPNRSARVTEADQRSVAISATEVQIAAAGVVATGKEPDSQTADSSPTSNQKNNGPPATEAIDAKSAPASAGLNTGNAAAPPKQATASAPADQSAASSGASEVDRVRFIQRVTGAFQAADDQGGQIRIRLSPPDLGSMRLEISVRNGVMTAHVQTETETARNMLLDHLPQLRERLADHNIKIDYFDVELTNQSRSGMQQNFADNAYQRQPAAPPGASRSRATSAASEPTAAATVAVRGANGRLDVTV